MRVTADSCGLERHFAHRSECVSSWQTGHDKVEKYCEIVPCPQMKMKKTSVTNICYTASERHHLSFKFNLCGMKPMSVNATSSYFTLKKCPAPRKENPNGSLNIRQANLLSVVCVC